MPTTPNTITINRMGGLGDAVATLDGQPVIIPYGVPGDVTTFRIRARNNKRILADIDQVITPSPHRREAPCAYFTQCGGCNLLHLTPSYYSEFKTGLLTTALARAGFTDAPISPLLQFGMQHRRRIELHVDASNGTPQVGFRQEGSHTLVNIDTCAIAVPTLSALIPACRTLALSLYPLIQRMQLTLCDNGIDARFTCLSIPDAAAQNTITAFAQQHTLLRLVLSYAEQHQMAHETAAPLILCGNTPVTLPHHGFVQASAEAQKAMTDIILRACENATRVLDLYAGIGTFTFPLLELGKKVAAYEGGRHSITAMQQAGAEYIQNGQLSAHVQDLYRSPLPAKTCKGFDAVIIDPPRNGAEPQMQELAKSRVPMIILISCNMQALERDGKILQQAGYKVQEAIPLDQFHGSHHLEAAIVFTL